MSSPLLHRDRTVAPPEAPASSPSLRLVAGGERAAEERRAEERLEDYLDHLCSPLLGVVPFRERQEMRREARSHLEMLIEEFVYEGLRPAEAAEAAFAEYGPPFLIGQSLLESWGQRRAARPRRRSALRFAESAPLVAFVTYGLAAVAGQALLQYFVGGSPRDQWMGYPYVIAFAVLAPVICGLIVGSIVPARAATATLKAYAFLLPHALVAALLMAPRTEGLWFALFQAAYGLPAALLSVCGAEAIARYRRLQRFWGRGKRESWEADIAVGAAAVR